MSGPDIDQFVGDEKIQSVFSLRHRFITVDYRTHSTDPDIFLAERQMCSTVQQSNNSRTDAPTWSRFDLRAKSAARIFAQSIYRFGSLSCPCGFRLSSSFAHNNSYVSFQSKLQNCSAFVGNLQLGHRPSSPGSSSAVWMESAGPRQTLLDTASVGGGSVSGFSTRLGEFAIPFFIGHCPAVSCSGFKPISDCR